MRSLYVHLIPLALLLIALCGGGPGCSDSSRGGPGAPVPDPQGLNATALTQHVSVPAPVTSSVPHAVTVWATGALVGYSTRPGGIHPSVRLTRSVLRPGESNTPLERLLEEVVLTRPEVAPITSSSPPALSPHLVGPPPGWQVVALVDRILLSVDYSVTPHARTEAEGLTDVVRKVIWVRATDGAVTPEGEALMPALAHELRHAHVYEAALKRGLTHDQAARESLAIDTPTPSP